MRPAPAIACLLVWWVATVTATLVRAGLLVAFPVGAAVVGSVVAAWRPPGVRTTSAVQHFAAGVVFAAAAGEVLPELKDEGHLGSAVVGFVVGVAVLLLVQQLERRAEQRPAVGRLALPVGLLAAVGVDLFIDGILVGLGATLGARQGLILTIALTLEIGFLALVVTAELADTAGSKTRAAAISAALALAVPAGALVAVLALADAPPSVLAAVLAGGIAALLFLVTEELVSEAHEAVTDNPLLTAMFFAGFLALYALEGAGG